MDLVTIGITCYNSETSIENCIKSALKQSHLNTEIIIYDDYSTDGSINKINQFKHNSKISLYVGDKNRGVGFARNYIVEKAKGKYICFFDDDDTSHKDRIKFQLQALQNQELKKYNGIFCYCSGQRIYRNGLIKNLNGPGLLAKAPSGIDISKYCLNLDFDRATDFGYGFPTCSFMSKKNDIIKLGSFDKKMRRLEDIDLAIRAGKEGYVMIGTEKKLFTQYSTVGGYKTPYKNYFFEKYLIEKYLKNNIDATQYRFLILWTKLRASWLLKKRYSSLFYFFKLIFLNPKKSFRKLFTSILNRLIHEYKSGQV